MLVALGVAAVAVLAQSEPCSRSVAFEAYDSFGDALNVLLVVDGQPSATTPVKLSVPCAATVAVRNVATGAEVPWLASPESVPAEPVKLRFPGRRQATVVSAVGSIDWVTPGWGDGKMLLGSGGARIDWWGKYLHLSAALRVTNYGYRWVIRSPAWPVLDAFAGFGYALGTEALRAFFALDLGVWSYATPTVRLSAALSFGRHFITAAFDNHFYPEGVLPQGMSRTLGYQDVPVINFIFWGLQLGYGVAFF
jgi:hypothetical protein